MEKETIDGIETGRISIHALVTISATDSAVTLVLMDDATIYNRSKPEGGVTTVNVQRLLDRCYFAYQKKEQPPTVDALGTLRVRYKTTPSEHALDSREIFTEAVSEAARRLVRNISTIYAESISD